MAEYKYECVKVRIRDGIGWASLNRPDKRNAMSPQLHYDMDDALARLEVDEDVKVVVVSGEGGNFSAGQDLQKFFRELETNPGERKKAAAAANRWRWERLYQYDKPTIAMVHGFCVGGAFMQLLGCDFAIAAENATFSLSEVNWGILPGALVSKVVADAVLPRHALYYACLGEPFDGKEAARIGMINSAVPLEKLEDAVTDLAERLMKKSPAVLRATKHAIRHVPHDGCAAGLRVPRRQGPGDQGRRQGGFLQHRLAAVPRREVVQADLRAVQARHAADRSDGRRKNSGAATAADIAVAAASSPRRRTTRACASLGGMSMIRMLSGCLCNARAGRSRPRGAQAQFYKGKTITMIVNYPAGGPTDLEGRIVALHLPAHIPGNPTIVVKNVGGAGGLIGSNQLGEAAPNGETIGFFTLDMPGQIVGDSALRTRYSDFVLIAGVESPLVVYIRKDTPPGINVAADLMKAQEFKALSLNAQNTNTLNQTLALDLLGAQVPRRSGLSRPEGGRDRDPAEHRAMANSSLSGWSGSVEPTMGHVVMPLWQLSPRKNGDAIRAARRCPICRRSRSSMRRCIPASRSPAITPTRRCARSAIRSSPCSGWR